MQACSWGWVKCGALYQPHNYWRKACGSVVLCTRTESSASVVQSIKLLREPLLTTGKEKFPGGQWAYHTMIPSESEKLM